MPNTDTFDLVTTYRLEGDQLVPVAVDGISLEAAPAQTAPTKAPEAGNENFLGAIERAMANR